MPGLQDFVAGDEVDLFVVGDGGVDVGGEEADAGAGAEGGLRGEGDVLVGAEPDLGVLDGGVAVVHAEGLEAAVSDRVVGGDGDHRGQQRERRAERQAELPGKVGPEHVWRVSAIRAGRHVNVALSVVFSHPQAVVEEVAIRIVEQVVKGAPSPVGLVREWPKQTLVCGIKLSIRILTAPFCVRAKRPS